MADTTVEIEKIGPDEARRMLGRNTHNRPINSRTVSALADAIRRDDWVLNGDAIRFGSDGALLDGQHRLHAVVIADEAIETLVVRGLSAPSQETMDIHHRRTIADMLALRGEKNCTTLAAAIRWNIRLLSNNPRSNQSSAVVSPQVAFRHLDVHPELRSAVERVGPFRSRLRTNPSVFAALIYQFRIRDSEDAEGFIGGVQVGAELEEDDSRFRLRQLLINEQTAINRMQTWRIAAMSIKAWNAYREGEPMKLLKFTVGGAKPEAWPEIR